MLGVVALAHAADVPSAPADALSQLGGQFQTAVAQNDAAGGAQTPNIGQALGGLLNSLGGAMGGNTPVTPVDFRSLQALLPEALPGLKRMNAGGANKQGMGIKSATAPAEYRGAGNQVIRVNIADVSGVSGVLAGYCDDAGPVRASAHTHPARPQRSSSPKRPRYCYRESPRTPSR